MFVVNGRFLSSLLMTGSHGPKTRLFILYTSKSSPVTKKPKTQFSQNSLFVGPKTDTDNYEGTSMRVHYVEESREKSTIISLIKLGGPGFWSSSRHALKGGVEGEGRRVRES